MIDCEKKNVKMYRLLIEIRNETNIIQSRYIHKTKISELNNEFHAEYQKIIYNWNDNQCDYDYQDMMYDRWKSMREDLYDSD